MSECARDLRLLLPAAGRSKHVALELVLSGFLAGAAQATDPAESFQRTGCVGKTELHHTLAVLQCTIHYGTKCPHCAKRSAGMVKHSKEWLLQVVMRVEETWCKQEPLYRQKT